ncbi:MAG: hypothetical protein ACOXZ7_00180 [Sphaerochaeta sp.]
MPKIDTTDTLFYSLLGRTLTDDELEAILPVAKAELDGHEDGILKIELNDTNRPDLWSAAGVARQIKSYWGVEAPLYDFFSTSEEEFDSEGRTLLVDRSVSGGTPLFGRLRRPGAPGHRG